MNHVVHHHLRRHDRQAWLHVQFAVGLLMAITGAGLLLADLMHWL